MPDLPDWYSLVTELEAEAYKFRGAADASKSTAPESRDVYFATDTKILYICVVDGSWTGFDASILVQGVLTLYENMAGGGKRITNIADPTAAQDAATRAYVLAQKALLLLLTGGTMSGDIAMGGNKVTGLGAPVAANDAVRKAYADLFTLMSILTDEGDLFIRGAATIERFAKPTTGKYIRATATGYEGVDLPAAGATVVTGNYTGDGTDGRQITTGFKCSCVIIWNFTDEADAGTWFIIGAKTFRLDASDKSTDALLHASDGFTVNGVGAKVSNSNGDVFYYWAISE